MEIKEIGRMIYTLRLKNGISQEELCQGLCSVAVLSRLELGERRPDILVFNGLIERLGRNPAILNTIMTLEEFEYFVKRRNVEISMNLGEYERAKAELLALEEEVKGEALRRQDINRLHGILALLEEDYEEAEEYLKKAVLETRPEFYKEEFGESDRLWLSETEMNLALLYAYAGERLGIETGRLLLYLKNYAGQKVTDEEVKNQRLSQIMYLIARQKKREEKWEECYLSCEAVIEAEVKNGAFSMLPQALRTEMLCLEQGASPENGELRKKEYEAVEKMLDTYGDSGKKEALFFLAGRESQEKHLIDEVISQARERKELTQEELSEDICTPETLSRIETGKRNPTVKNFHALMKKLGLGMGYYNTDFKAKHFETLEKGRKLQRENILRRYEKAERLLEEIEMEIDATELENCQYLEFYHTVFDWKLHRIDNDEALQRVEAALELRLDRKDGKFQVPRQMTTREIYLFNVMSNIFSEKGKKKEAAEILEEIYQYFKESKITKALGASEHGKQYLMVLSNLASYTEESNNLEKAMEYIEEAIQEGIRTRSGVRLGRNMATKGYIQERMQKEICLKTYEQAYYLTGLYEDFMNQNILKNHVKEKFGRILSN